MREAILKKIRELWRWSYEKHRLQSPEDYEKLSDDKLVEAFAEYIRGVYTQR